MLVPFYFFGKLGFSTFFMTFLVASKANRREEPPRSRQIDRWTEQAAIFRSGRRFSAIVPPDKKRAWWAFRFNQG